MPRHAAADRVDPPAARRDERLDLVRHDLADEPERVAGEEEPGDAGPQDAEECGAPDRAVVHVDGAADAIFRARCRRRSSRTALRWFAPWVSLLVLTPHCSARRRRVRPEGQPGGMALSSEVCRVCQFVHRHGYARVVRLYLCRHAEAAPGEPDELRELTATGLEQARALGARLATLPEPPGARAREPAPPRATNRPGNRRRNGSGGAGRHAPWARRDRSRRSAASHRRRRRRPRRDRRTPTGLLGDRRRLDGRRPWVPAAAPPTCVRRLGASVPPIRRSPETQRLFRNSCASNVACR